MDNTELKAIQFLIFDPQSLQTFISKSITTGFFYNELHKTIYKLMLDYHMIYGQYVSKDILEAELSKFYSPEDFKDVVTFNTAELLDINPAWMADQLISYKKTKILKEGIESLIKNADESSIKDAEQHVAKLHAKLARLDSNAEFVFDVGTESRAYIETLTIKKQNNGVMTGFKHFDDVIHGLKPGWLTVLVARPKVGKCHGFNTPILMHDGSIKMVQDIQVGEALMGDDSTPRIVQSLARGEEDMYRIIPNKGDSFECNGSHILVLKKSGKRLDKDLPRYLEISVNDYIKRSKELVKYKLYRVGVEFKKKEVSKYLPPYLLGMWLGDGSSAYPEITTMDKELVTYLEEFTKSIGANLCNYVHDPKKCPRYSITFSEHSGKSGSNLVWEELRKLNLINNKHIPAPYKINSRDVRLNVLAGLIDTDGHLTGNKKNIYEISTKSETLKNDILYISRSLGFGATARLEKKGIKSTGFVGHYWRIFISGDISVIPTRLSRKIAKTKAMETNHRDALLTGFSIKSLGYGNYYGFELDGNHRYLLGDFTVTHNTRTLVNLAYNMIKRKSNVLVFSIEVERDQYTNLLYSCMTEMQFSKIDDHALSADDLERIKMETDKVGNEYGRLTIVDTQGSTTPNKIKFAIEQAENSLGIKYDVVIIDHASMVNPDVPQGKDNLNQAKVAEELKDMARELRKVVVTAVQMKQASQETSKKDKEKLSGEGQVSRSDMWFQVPDLLLFIQNTEEEAEGNIFGILKFKVISRFSQNFKFELLKDFSVTKLYSNDGSNFSSGSAQATSSGERSV